MWSITPELAANRLKQVCNPCHRPFLEYHSVCRQATETPLEQASPVMSLNRCTHTHHVYFSDLSTLSDFPASCPPDSPVEWFKKVRSSLLIPLIRVALKARDTEMTALEGFLQRAGLKCLTHAEHLKTWHSVKSEEQRWLASTPSVSANMSMCFVSFSLDSHALHNPDSPPKVVTLLHASGKSSEVWSFTAKQHCSILLNNRSRWGLCFKTQQNRFDLERLY